MALEGLSPIVRGVEMIKVWHGERSNSGFCCDLITAFLHSVFPFHCIAIPPNSQTRCEFLWLCLVYLSSAALNLHADRTKKTTAYPASAAAGISTDSTQKFRPALTIFYAGLRRFSISLTISSRDLLPNSASRSCV